MQDESITRRSVRFIVAIFCIAMVTLLLCGIHRSAWKGVLLSVAMSSVTLFSLLLLAFRWANQHPSVETSDDSASDEATRPIQFRISTLLLLTLLVGVYLGVLRDAVVKLAEGSQGSFEQAFAMFAWTITLVVGMFLPWLIIANALLSGLAKIVKRPWGRRLILAFFQPRP